MQEQKLVTFYLDSGQEYVRDKSGGESTLKAPREHLSQYLEDGWVVKSIDTLGGHVARVIVML